MAAAPAGFGRCSTVYAEECSETTVIRIEANRQSEDFDHDVFSWCGSCCHGSGRALRMRPEVKEYSAINAMRATAEAKSKMLATMSAWVEAWGSGDTDATDALLLADYKRIAPD